ncbi:hypothetical protein AB4152_03930 [Vibrio breoganii]
MSQQTERFGCLGTVVTLGFIIFIGSKVFSFYAETKEKLFPTVSVQEQMNALSQGEKRAIISKFQEDNYLEADGIAGGLTCLTYYTLDDKGSFESRVRENDAEALEEAIFNRYIGHACETLDTSVSELSKPDSLRLVKLFQEEQQLHADGIVGNQSCLSLENSQSDSKITSSSSESELNLGISRLLVENRCDNLTPLNMQCQAVVATYTNSHPDDVVVTGRNGRNVFARTIIDDYPVNYTCYIEKRRTYGFNDTYMGMENYLIAHPSNNNLYKNRTATVTRDLNDFKVRFYDPSQDAHGSKAFHLSDFSQAYRTKNDPVETTNNQNTSNKPLKIEINDDTIDFNVAGKNLSIPVSLYDAVSVTSICNRYEYDGYGDKNWKAHKALNESHREQLGDKDYLSLKGEVLATVTEQVNMTRIKLTLENRKETEEEFAVRVCKS